MAVTLRTIICTPFALVAIRIAIVTRVLSRPVESCVALGHTGSLAIILRIDEQSLAS